MIYADINFFFTGNQQLLLYQEMQIIALTVVLIDKVFKGCFNKQSCNFDNVSKIGNSTPS